MCLELPRSIDRCAVPSQPFFLDRIVQYSVSLRKALNKTDADGGIAGIDEADVRFRFIKGFGIVFDPET